MCHGARAHRANVEQPGRGQPEGIRHVKVCGLRVVGQRQHQQRSHDGESGRPMTELVEHQAIHERQDAKRHRDAHDSSDDEQLRVGLEGVVQHTGGRGCVDRHRGDTEQSKVKRRINGCPLVTEMVMKNVFDFSRRDLVYGPASIVGKPPGDTHREHDDPCGVEGKHFQRPPAIEAMRKGATADDLRGDRAEHEAGPDQRKHRAERVDPNAVLSLLAGDQLWNQRSLGIRSVGWLSHAHRISRSWRPNPS